MVILVDENDNPIGECKKLEAHEKGLLHRAFSVLLFNNKGEMLLQQRAIHKYHSPGLWTNTCCSHPRPGEDTFEAATRRLEEEMGMEGEFKFSYKFTYKVSFSNALIEHETDHVFIGKVTSEPEINKDEVHAYKYESIDNIKKDIALNSEIYTPWFKLIIEEKYSDNLNK